jgi:tetratricopeptide (TPR) repeat protein
MRRLLLLFIFSLCSRADTVLVLPFFNDSPSDALDWIAESVSQTTQEALASQGLLVLEREDREEAYRRLSIRTRAHLTHASVIKVAEALDATDVVYGTFELSPPREGAPAGTPGTLHLTARTLNMKRMRAGPEFMESGPLDDLASLQSHLAWQVARYLAPDTTPPLKEFLKERPPVRLDAMENYTRGLLAASPEQKHRYFTQAARLDERLSEAMFELGKLYWKQKEYRFAADWFSKLKPPAPRYTEGNFLLGLCRYYLGDFAGAQQAFASVAASVPLNEVFNNLGAAQSRRNLPEASDNFEKALEGDPGDPDYFFNLGLAFWKRGDYARAADSFRAVLDRNPEDAQATLLLGRCLKQTPPSPADLQAGYERLKLNYEEGAWRQLKAALEAGRKKSQR